ncbi:uncharacterized protein L201_002001 [Kwoniella dendrophila CBS 6074]|uniref:HSF-type DNA-binding domain-containing protein n=1 Tax=Kwoniella dendrophila CBS 6074 TaxID=1295534 RepID=A0AAX4JP01_9TREE
MGRYSAINGGSKPPNFLQKLYDFLSLEPHPCPEIMYWATDSRQLVIAQPDKLAKEVLPKLYKHDKIASFGRQLNIYGFSRLFPGRQFKDSNGNISDASVWAHPTLNRLSTPSELLTIKRRAPPKLIRTRRLANGEIIRTRAGPGVIEKAKQVKEEMLNSKSNTSTKPNLTIDTELADSGSNNNNDNIDKTDNLTDNLRYMNTNKLDKILLNNDFDSPYTCHSNTTSQSIWPYVQLNSSFTTMTNTLPVPRMQDTPKSIFKQPLNLFPSYNQKLYSSCPASMSTSPTMTYHSTPFRSFGSLGNDINIPSSIPSFNNSNTTDTVTNPFVTAGESNSGPTDQNIHVNITDFSNSLNSTRSSLPPISEYGQFEVAPSQQRVPFTADIPKPAGAPRRIAAPAAPVPSHLLHNQILKQNQDTPSETGLFNSSTTSNGFSLSPKELILSTPTFNPVPPNNDNNGNLTGLSSSWNKSAFSDWIENAKPFATRSKTAGRFIGNETYKNSFDNEKNNGTIDPKWISPLSSGWSTPINEDFPNHIHSNTIPPSQNGEGVADTSKLIPSFNWYTPSHLSILNSPIRSTDQNDQNISDNNDNNHEYMKKGNDFPAHSRRVKAFYHESNIITHQPKQHSKHLRAYYRG